LKVVLDQNVPAPLARLLQGHDARHTSNLGWEALSNGDLLAAAEADGFELLITADKNIRYQQNLTQRTIALIVLSTNDWPTIRSKLQPIVAAVNQATTGSYLEIDIGRPELQRRPAPPGYER
jgi:predicted nuclease of predicted toxin-antitoxin system